MKRIKNNEIASKADAMVNQRWGAIDIDIGVSAPKKIESIEEFLARGGKINTIGNITTVTSPPKPTQPKKIKEQKKMDAHKMTAVEAAKQAGNMTCGQVVESIPDYKHPLPRRSWVKKFLESISPDLLPKFEELKNLYKSQ